MIVKIIKCSKSTYWYNDKIGCTFKVDRFMNNFIIPDENKNWIKSIDVSDCEIIKEEVEFDHYIEEIIRNPLNDDDYINCRKEYNVVRGNIIFHGGCLVCKSQKINGVDRCRGCMYFRADWKKPNLRIK
jgi:hypothetical protein